MRKTIIVAILAMLPIFAGAQTTKDWASFKTFREANEKVTKAPVAVLFGDSITEVWAQKDPSFFDAHDFIGRGISGQTTSQMLVRFRRDVIDLHPRIVVIMGGTNDIALNNGVISLDDVLGNIISMVQLARANKIVPVLCSVTPCAKYSWRPEVTTAAQDIVKLNGMIKAYAYAQGIMYIDYHSALKDGKDAMREGLSKDGCHPVLETYQSIMEPVLMNELEKLPVYQKARNKR